MKLQDIEIKQKLKETISYNVRTDCDIWHFCDAIEFELDKFYKSITIEQSKYTTKQTKQMFEVWVHSQFADGLQGSSNIDYLCDIILKSLKEYTVNIKTIHYSILEDICMNLTDNISDYWLNYYKTQFFDSLRHIDIIDDNKKELRLIYMETGQCMTDGLLLFTTDAPKSLLNDLLKRSNKYYNEEHDENDNNEQPIWYETIMKNGYQYHNICYIEFPNPIIHDIAKYVNEQYCIGEK